MEKSKNRQIRESHFIHKEAKLRKRLHEEEEHRKKLAQEAEKLEEENRENFVFRLADKSFPPSECDSDGSEHVGMKELPPAYKKFDYPVNESELYSFKRQLSEKPLDAIKNEKLLPTMHNGQQDNVGEVGTTCGQKLGNRVVLRNFHDRISDEPRGESNCHRSSEAGKSTCFTHKEWLDSIANDPELLVNSFLKNVTEEIQLTKRFLFPMNFRENRHEAKFYQH